MTDSLTFLHLMAAKICHDFASPLGALGLGIEMLEDLKTLDDSTKDLLGSSLDNGKSKIHFYRKLLGTDVNGPTCVEVDQTLNPHFKSHHIEMIWHDGFFVEEGWGSRILLGTLWLLSECMARGGKITIARDESYLFLVHAIGPMVQWRPGYEEVIATEQGLDVQTPRTILPYYVKKICTSQGLKMEIHNIQDNEIMLKICA